MASAFVFHVLSDILLTLVKRCGFWGLPSVHLLSSVQENYAVSSCTGILQLWNVISFA